VAIVDMNQILTDNFKQRSVNIKANFRVGAFTKTKERYNKQNIFVQPFLFSAYFRTLLSLMLKQLTKNDWELSVQSIASVNECQLVDS